MDWIVAHPAAATALATMALVAVGLVIGAGQIAVVWFGISRMTRAGAAREREQERRHEETMKAFAERALQNEKRHEETMKAFAEQERRHEETMKAFAEQERRHEETMKAFAERERQNERRHKEAMELGERRHKEAMEALAAERRALEALIERTAPRPPSAE